jgi:CRISPR system Cascade subunit CasC
MIIELHAIQTFGPSNLNRDDTGNPKESLFGGVQRARISSQCSKRAIRVSPVFEKEIGIPTGTRTKTLIAQLMGRLVEAGLDEEQAQAAAAEVIGTVFAKPDKKDPKKTSVLVYISNDEFNLLVDYILEAQQTGEFPKNMAKDLTKKLKSRRLAPDIALFGRMLAEHPDLNVDAASQVAHAISTHAVHTAEFDYFTAVDDLIPDEETGAGMLGLVAFNSATYYRCVRIDWEQLVENLHGDVDLAVRTISGFMKAFALVVPSGMENSFVNQHAPDFLLAVTRPDNDGQSLDNAFEQPIRTRRGSGYAEPSIVALATYWEQVDRAYRLSKPVASVMNPRGYELPSEELTAAVQPNLKGWIDVILAQLTETSKDEA